MTGVQFPAKETFFMSLVLYFLPQQVIVETYYGWT